MATSPGATLRAGQIRDFLRNQSVFENFENPSTSLKNWFKLSDEHQAAVQNASPSFPDSPDRKIKSIGETAFQRAIFYQRPRTKANFPEGEQEIEWLDLELPVIPGNRGRRRSCDLVARIADLTTICELKYSRAGVLKTREPYYPVFQLLVQMQLVALNADQLRHRSETTEIEPFKRFLWHDIAGADRALIAANKRWWAGIGPSESERLEELVKKVKIHLGIELLLFETEDVDFAKDSMAGYMPEWTMNSEPWKLIFKPGP